MFSFTCLAPALALALTFNGITPHPATLSSTRIFVARMLACQYAMIPLAVAWEVMALSVPTKSLALVIAQTTRRLEALPY